MAWYWWVIIGIGVIAIGYLKIMLFQSIRAKSAAKKPGE